MSGIVERLTGRIRYRTGWFGKLVLQVEVWQWPEYKSPHSFPPPTWRDATVQDLAVDEARTGARTTTPTPPPTGDTKDAAYPSLDVAAYVGHTAQPNCEESPRE